MQANVNQGIRSTGDTKDDMLLELIEALDKCLTEHFSETLVIDNALTQKLVSFQANKARTY